MNSETHTHCFGAIKTECKRNGIRIAEVVMKASISIIFFQLLIINVKFCRLFSGLLVWGFFLFLFCCCCFGFSLVSCQNTAHNRTGQEFSSKIHFCWKCLIIKTEVLSESILFPVWSQVNIGWHFSAPDCCFTHSSKRSQWHVVSDVFGQVSQDWEISSMRKHQLCSSWILEAGEKISVLHQAAQNHKKELSKHPGICRGDNPGSCSQQVLEFPANMLQKQQLQVFPYRNK